MAHQYMPKMFHDPNKNPPAPPPTYLMYGPLLYFFNPGGKNHVDLQGFCTWIKSQCKAQCYI